MSHDERDVETVAEVLGKHRLIGARCRCGYNARLDYYRYERHVTDAVLDALDLPGRERRAKAEERVDVQGRLDDVLGFLSDDGRYGYDQHPHELCGPDHHVCALVSHLMNAVIDPDWLTKLKAARERVSRAAELDPEEEP